MGRKRHVGTPPNPSGLCMCGCGGTTPLAPCSGKHPGWLIGEHIPYLNGHSGRWAGKIHYLVDPTTDCWIWQGGLSHNGYAITSVNGSGRNADRVYYEQAYGPIPEGMQVDHLCVDPRCVNPAHLEAVSPAVNTQRSRVAKLTAEDVVQIRDLYSSGAMGTDLADRYGVTAGCIYAVTTYRTWRNIP